MIYFYTRKRNPVHCSFSSHVVTNVSTRIKAFTAQQIDHKWSKHETPNDISRLTFRRQPGTGSTLYCARAVAQRQSARILDQWIRFQYLFTERFRMQAKAHMRLRRYIIFAATT